MSNVTRICTQCGHGNTLDARYCAQCGYDSQANLPAVPQVNLPALVGKAASARAGGRGRAWRSAQGGSC